MNTNDLIASLVKKYCEAFNARRRVRYAIDVMKHSRWAEQMRRCYSINRSNLHKSDKLSFRQNTVSGIKPVNPVENGAFVSKRVKQNHIKSAEYWVNTTLNNSSLQSTYQEKLLQIKNTPVSELGKNWIKYVELSLQDKRLSEKIRRLRTTIKTLNKEDLGVKVFFGNGSGLDFSRIYSLGDSRKDSLSTSKWLDNYEFEKILTDSP